MSEREKKLGLESTASTSTSSTANPRNIMTIITFETLTIDARDEAEADVSAALALGSVTINHDAYGEIEVRHFEGWWSITLDGEEHFTGSDEDCVQQLVELYR